MSSQTPQGAANESATRPLVLVRRPSPGLADGELTHLQRQPIDAELALEQWQAYVDAFTTHGWGVQEVEPADDHPDGVFVEDVVVMFGDLAVLCSPGARSRRGEVASVQRTVETLPSPGLALTVTRIEPPGTLDGGDVLKVADTVYVGQGSRTNAEGVRQLTALVQPRGYHVVSVAVRSVLHLKSGVTALPDGTVIGYPPLVDERGTYPSFLPVPEEHGTAVVDLGHGVVLMSADAPKTAELLAARGLQVVPVAISEFERLEGCVTCLSVRVR